MQTIGDQKTDFPAKDMKIGITGRRVDSPALAKQPKTHANTKASGKLKRPKSEAETGLNVIRSRHQRASASSTPPPKTETTKPLDLVVVGQQLTMNHMHRRVPAVTSRVPRSLAGGRSTRGSPVAQTFAPLGQASFFPAQQPMQFVEDGEYMYVYESYPYELWKSAQLDMPQESPSLLAKEQPLFRLPQQQQVVPESQQVLDSRFFAELFDEALMYNF